MLSASVVASATGVVRQAFTTPRGSSSCAPNSPTRTLTPTISSVNSTPSPSNLAAGFTTLWRFVFKGNLVGGMFNADPHPGNYLFQPDGSIIFLDFGCIQPIAGNRIEAARDLHRAALRKDDAAFRRAAAVILESKGGTYEEAATAYSRKCFEPVFASPFRITQAFATSLVHDIKTVKEQLWAKDKSFVQLPSGMLFMNRLQFGFYSVLARLDVEVDYADVERRFLAEAGLS